MISFIRNPSSAFPAKFVLGLTCILLAACNPASQAPDQKSPNIIFLLADDQSAGTLSSAGHPVLQTPNLDHLAQQGTVFNNAFTVQPICAPSRFAIFTSQYERTNGLGFSSPYQATEAQWKHSYPEAFRRAGYFTGFIGKFGVEFYEFRGRTNEMFDFWKGHDGWLSFFIRDNPADTPIESYAQAEHEIATEVMGESIAEFLNAAPSDRPFQLSVSFSAPHGSMTSSMFLDADITHCETSQCRKMGVPANLNPRLANHPIYSDLYRDAAIEAPADVEGDPYAHLPPTQVGHEKRQQWYDYLYDATTNVEHMIRYYQQITGIDAVVGQLWQQLEEKELLENTIIVYSSDHGLITGQYGIGGKGLLYDQAAKVPLIVFDPRQRQKAQSDALVLTIDLAPTMLAMAGITPPESMQGQSLTPLLDSPDKTWREFVLLESLTTVEDKNMSEALRSQDWKYIRYFATPGCPYNESDLTFEQRPVAFEQLFDLTQDPHERSNLAEDRQFQAKLQEMRKELASQSGTLTAVSTENKRVLSLPPRPAGAGCW